MYESGSELSVGDTRLSQRLLNQAVRPASEAPANSDATLVEVFERDPATRDPHSQLLGRR